MLYNTSLRGILYCFLLDEVTGHMKRLKKAEDTSGYPVRVAARMTGLKPELLRAWETRYRAVTPTRTQGGSRLYSGEDLDRLMLLRDVVESGHRIGRVAHLSIDELQGLLPESRSENPNAIERIIAVFQRLDGVKAQRLLTDELTKLGSIEFATNLVLPLLFEIGRRWERGDLTVSVEHLATAVLRSILMTLVDAENENRGSPKVVFATPSGEPHDLGTLVASIVANRAGSDLVFLGADVPAEDLVDCVVSSNASALVLGIVTLPQVSAERILREIRKELPKEIGVFVGGAGIQGLSHIKGIDRVDNLVQLEAQITHLTLGGTASNPSGQDSGGLK
jgi:methanogenic corrinoid protein MtbC1